ncbi:PREDICTED: serine/arginine repetitive matrix protein 2-like [Priapulus caudatus]|uniref:Serine/arginine repetitive matrix protein 2-like n=1 Tax=Priapulus caudatus TaxID=37621 RepID=A0ABM1ERT6_PRICU|nr:PREDICTED: serine/arginine repetitive matrix protein 2-like [Priapulus caudatus]
MSTFSRQLHERSAERVHRLRGVFETAAAAERDASLDPSRRAESLQAMAPPSDSDGEQYQHNSYPPYSRSVKRRTRTCTQVIALAGDDDDDDTMVAISKYKGAKMAMGVNGLRTKWKHERLCAADGGDAERTSSVIPPYVPAGSSSSEERADRVARCLVKKNSLPTAWEEDEMAIAADAEAAGADRGDNGGSNDMANSVPTNWKYAQQQAGQPSSRKHSLPELLLLQHHMSEVGPAAAALDAAPHTAASHSQSTSAAATTTTCSTPIKPPPAVVEATAAESTSEDRSASPSALRPSLASSQPPRSDAQPTGQSFMKSGSRTGLPTKKSPTKIAPKPPLRTVSVEESGASSKEPMDVQERQRRSSGERVGAHHAPAEIHDRQRHGSGGQVVSRRTGQYSTPAGHHMPTSPLRKSGGVRSALPMITMTSPPSCSAPERPASASDLNTDDLAAFGEAEENLKLLTPSEDESEGEAGVVRMHAIAMATPEQLRTTSTPASVHRPPTAASSINEAAMDSLLSDDGSDISIEDVNVTLQQVWRRGSKLEWKLHDTSQVSRESFGRTASHTSREEAELLSSDVGAADKWNLHQLHGKPSPPAKCIPGLPARGQHVSPQSSEFSVISMSDAALLDGAADDTVVTATTFEKNESWVNVSSNVSTATTGGGGDSRTSSSFDHVAESNSSFADVSGDVAAINNNNYLPDLTATCAGSAADPTTGKDVRDAAGSRERDDDDDDDDTVPSPTSPNAEASYEIISSESYVDETSDVIATTAGDARQRQKQRGRALKALSPVSRGGKLLSQLRQGERQTRPVGKVLPSFHATLLSEHPDAASATKCVAVECAAQQDPCCAPTALVSPPGGAGITQSLARPAGGSRSDSLRAPALVSARHGGAASRRVLARAAARERVAARVAAGCLRAHRTARRPPRRQLPQKVARRGQSPPPRAASPPGSPGRRPYGDPPPVSPRSRDAAPASPRPERLARAAELEHMDMVEKRSLLPKMNEARATTAHGKSPLQALQALRRPPGQRSPESSEARASPERTPQRRRETSSDELRSSSSSSRSSEQSPPPPHSPVPPPLAARREASPKPKLVAKPAQPAVAGPRPGERARRERSPASKPDAAAAKRPEIPKPAASKLLQSPLARKRENGLAKSKLPGLKGSGEQERCEEEQHPGDARSPPTPTPTPPGAKTPGPVQKSVIKVTSFMRNDVPAAKQDKRPQEKAPSTSKLSTFGFRSPKVQRSDKITAAAAKAQAEKAAPASSKVNGHMSKIPGKKELMSPKSPRIPRAVVGKQAGKTSNGSVRGRDTGKQGATEHVASLAMIGSDEDGDTCTEGAVINRVPTDCQGKEKVKTPSRPRRSLLRFGLKDFFFRFGDKEKAALNTFEFLETGTDLPVPTEGSSDARSEKAPSGCNGANVAEPLSDNSAVGSPDNLSDNEFYMSDTCAEDYQSD